MKCQFGCAGSLDSILACDIFTLTDVSFHYSSEKNEQAHARGKNSQINDSKTGFG